MEPVHLEIPQGETYSRVLRYGALPWNYTPISAIIAQAPARITVAANAIPNGWPVAVVSVKGMIDINAAASPPGAGDFHSATVISSTIVELNDVNAAGFKAYSSSGYLQWHTPVSLAGGIARLTVKNKERNGTVLVELDSDALGGIVIDNTAKTIIWTFDADDSEGYTWTRGYFQVEFESASGTKKKLERGTIELKPQDIIT